MAKLEFSHSAKRVMRHFYQAGFLVYVEGDDDVGFWEFLFEKFSSHPVYVKPVGGKENLAGYIGDIFEGEINDLVAMDSDFSCLEGLDTHRNILTTYGYSIENTLICDRSLREVIRTLGKIPAHGISVHECQQWLQGFFDKSKDLVIHDIKNHLDGYGEVVVGDHCARFMRSGKSVEICDHKVSEYIDELGFSLDDEDRQEVVEKIGEKGLAVEDLMRGHFLFSAALRFTAETIGEKRKQISISKESYLGSLVMAFKNTFDDGHPEYRYYQSVISDVCLPT